MVNFNKKINYLRGIIDGKPGAKNYHQGKQEIGRRPSGGLGHDRRRLTTRADHHKT